MLRHFYRLKSKLIFYKAFMGLPLYETQQNKCRRYQILDIRYRQSLDNNFGATHVAN